jgi:metal-responsive CopG/Arc/MetJ family transcriptional regulator
MSSLHRVNLNIDDELWERFRAVAEAHYRSRSDHIRFLMAQAVEQHDGTPWPRFKDALAAVGEE